MTPKQKAKEKAKELINKFIPYSDTHHDGSYANAKQCALMALTEILDKDGYNNDYWKEVKQELDKL